MLTHNDMDKNYEKVSAFYERERVKTPLKTVGGSGVAFLLPLFLVITGFLFFPNITFAANRYWVGGGSSANWNATTPTNWGSASNTQDDASVPGASDDVFFDGVGTCNSASTISASITINSLDMTGYANTLTHNASVTLTHDSSGVFKLASGMTYTLGNVRTSAVTFTGISGTTAITTAGKTVGNITLSGTGGTWQLQDALTTSGDLQLDRGTFDSNSQTMIMGTLSVSGTNARTLTLGSSAITITGGGSANNFYAVNVTGLTVTANTAVVTITGGSAATYIATKDWNGLSLVFTGGGSMVGSGGNSTWANITVTGTAFKHNSIYFDGNPTITGTFTINGNSTINRVLVKSSSLGTARTITAANTSFSNVDFQDITGAGAGSWDLSAITGGSGDALGNSGITFTTAATQYWTGNTGSWSVANQWCTTSGGCADNAGDGRTPLPQDDVRFDANSFSSASRVASLDMPRAGKNIDWTGATNNPDWAKVTDFANGMADAYVYGSITLVSGMTTSGGSFSYREIYMQGRSALTFTSAGKTFDSPFILQMPGGTLTFQDAFNSSSYLTLTTGTLNANNFNATATAITISGSATRTLTMGSGIWAVSGTGTVWDATTITGLTFNSDTSTTTVSNVSATAKTFIGGGLTYNNASFSGDNITVTGSNTFNTLGLNNAGLSNGLKLTSGTTQTVSGFISNGSSGSITLLSATPSGIATLSKSSGTVSVDYISIASSTATGGATWNVGANSTDVGNNTGWTFAGSLTTPVLTVQAASSVTNFTATLNGTITDTGGQNNIVRGFQYGTTTSYGLATSTSGSYDTGAYAMTIENIFCNTTYHVRAYSTNNLTTGYSSDTTFTTSACPTTWYVSTTGANTNNGSISYPWNLGWALDGASTTASLIQPGDIVYLRGGTYTFATTTGEYTYTVSLSGSSASPITVQSYTGEWAKVDGTLNGVATKNYTMFDILGDYVWYKNFEITNSETATRKIADSSSNPSTRRGNSVDDKGTGNKLINLVIHDTGQGIGGWANGDNNEYYGNIIYNNGWDAPDRGHGHNIYTQNDTGWKRYFNNILLNAFSNNIQMYGSSASDLNNFTFEGNSWANNTVLFGGNSPINGLDVFKNYFYRVGPQLGYGNSDNTNIFFYKNYIASSTLSMSLSKDVTVSYNTIIRPTSGQTYLISLTYNGTAPVALTDYVIDYNTYYKVFGDVGEAFYSPTTAVTGSTCNFFWFNSSSQGYGYCGAQPDSWQDDLGYDLNGTYTASAPTTDVIFYRKNKYDDDRMNVITYNWDGNTTVSVDPSLVLDNGDSYEIHNTQDYFDDVITGTYSGSNISIAMDTGSRTLEKPIGYDEVVAGGGWYTDPLQTTTFPTFGAFVVVNTSGTTDVANPVISNVASTTDTTTATITWDTDEDSTTVLNFGPTTSYGTASTTDDGTIYGTFYTTTHEITLTGLSPGTLYHYRLTDVDYAGNSVTSGDYTFTTDAVAPTIVTSAASSVATSAATFNGSISVTGGADATQSGFAYGTVADLSTVIATSTLGAQTGTASFTENLTGLTPNTTYYFRAYATNSAGTGYGSILSTTTVAITLSTLTTSAASSITSTSATLNGSIDSTGGADATQHGFAYGTYSSLTTVIATTTEGAFSGTGAFTSDITSLTCSTTYYARAYSTNSAGTAYGSIESLTTSACPLPSSSSSSGGSSSGSRRHVIVENTPDTSIISQITQNIPFFRSDEPSTTEETVAPIPVEEPSLSLSSLSSGWDLFSSESLSDFVLSPLPKQLVELAKKFPKLEDTFKKLGITTISDLDKLRNTSFSLPKVGDEFPVNVVLAKGTGGKIDLDSSIVIDEKGSLEQKVELLSNTRVTLLVKPDAPTSKVSGYLLFKKSTLNPVAQIPSSSEAALSILPILVAHAAEIPPPKPEMLVQSFIYTDPDKDGIYSAEIQTPAVEGIYEVVTLISYRDKDLGAKELRLTTVIDPEGYVFKQTKDGEIRISGAEVFLYHTEDNTLWNAIDYSQKNPQKTDKSGRYAFLVPEGKYYITVETSGYKYYKSVPFDVREGEPVHFNIEMEAEWSFVKIFDWKFITILILIIIGFIKFRKR